MPPVGFKPMISAGKRPHTYALERAATGTGTQQGYYTYKMETSRIKYRVGKKYSVRTGSVPPNIMEYHMFQHKLPTTMDRIRSSPNATPSEYSWCCSCNSLVPWLGYILEISKTGKPMFDAVL